MKIELDVHTHTIASGHAFSTLQEMAQAAADKGLKVLGITEHSPGVPGTCHPIYFRNLHVVPRRMYVFGGNKSVVFGDKKFSGSTQGVNPDYALVSAPQMFYGRYINEMDVRQQRKIELHKEKIY